MEGVTQTLSDIIQCEDGLAIFACAVLPTHTVVRQDEDLVTLSAGSGVSLTVNTKSGAYSIGVDNVVWLTSGKWNILGSTPLLLASRSEKGNDMFGPFTMFGLDWGVVNQPQREMLLETNFRAYTNSEMIIFQQVRRGHGLVCVHVLARACICVFRLSVCACVCVGW